MLFGPDRVVACPLCTAAARVFTLRTANNLGASYWTDGFVFMPGCWEPPAVTRCSACGALHWLEDAPTLGFMPERQRFKAWTDGSFQEPEPSTAAVPEPWERAPRVRGLTLDELLAAIEARVWGERGPREIQLRTLAWQASSHRNRNRRRKKDRQKTPADRRNMEALFASELSGDPVSALVRAEIRRQLGDHRVSVAILDNAPAGPQFAPRAARIRELSLRTNTAVATVPLR